MAEKLDAVAAERVKFHLDEKVVPKSSDFNARRETVSILEEPDHIYGRDEDKEKIADILVNQVTDCEQLSVLPIIGVGGLGKTTLAQLVFNDERVSQHFDTKLWVCVSDNFDLKILLEAIIVSATGSTSNLVQLDALQCRLREVLSHKKYLLILDDVWNDNQEDWVKLKSILACGSKGVSVVITTRLKKVADIMGTLPAHCLGELSEEHSWLLFKLRAFGIENKVYPKLEYIGRQILKKCAGVPLAAKALGGLLRFNRTENEWIHIKESEIWNLPEEETSILPALRLSYRHLPFVLRRCFVYCAVFPKDYKIEKQDLIFRWMAHGCISSDGTQQVEDVGEKIWNELVLRSFFQDIQESERETTFKMHDLVHDLALSIMENKVPGAHMNNNSLGASNSKIREVYWSRGLITSPSVITPQESTLSTIMNYCRLRILKLKHTKAEKLPSGIGKLKHLRYLDLSYSSIRSLPHTFCGLWNLQILVLNCCCNLERLPKHIRYMTNLRHIFLQQCEGLSHMPPRIGELTFLKTLSLFIVGHKLGNQLDELEHLNLGGKLDIKHLERIQNPMNAKKTNLVGKLNLFELFLHWEGDGTSELAKTMDDEKVLEVLEPHPNLERLEIVGFRGSYFPLWMTKMENVTRILVEDCPNCSHLPLGDLPCLKSLFLGNLDALEYIVDEEIRGQNSVRAKFPSLEELNLYFLRSLKGLLKEGVGEVLPNLRRMHIKDCQLLILPPLSALEWFDLKEFSLLTLSSFSYKLENLSFLSLDFDKINTMTCIPEDVLDGLCNLKELKIWKAREHLLPEKWFQGLKSLKILRIFDCNIENCFPKGWLRHLTALEELIISFCLELVELPEEIKYLHLLKRLTLNRLHKTESLPQVLQHVNSLEYLDLFDMSLTSLPEWLGNLTSFTHLGIVHCEGVSTLPSCIQGMRNLRFLSIWYSPQLQRRCEREKGEDWYKIAHIAQLDFL